MVSHSELDPSLTPVKPHLRHLRGDLGIRVQAEVI